jgi:nitroimidazol reductase NimA-like FMN-containing flavoprotein (pyridoxamine 5'-phosphate oxidase superfamily)
MITELDPHEAEKLLAEKTLGRLGSISKGEPYAVPVYYHFDGENVYIHSPPGKKIVALHHHNRACLLVDEIADPYRWRSVIAYSDYEEAESHYGSASSWNSSVDCLICRRSSRRFRKMTEI